MIENGTIVMRNGVIEDVGAIDDRAGRRARRRRPGCTCTRASSTWTTRRSWRLEALSGRRGGAGRGRGGGGAPPRDSLTSADQEREARAAFLRPDVDAAASVAIEGDDPAAARRGGRHHRARRAVAGHLRGQSALVNVAIPPDPNEICAIGTTAAAWSSCDPAWRST